MGNFVNAYLLFPPVAGGNDALLLESGDFFLLESGDKLELE